MWCCVALLAEGVDRNIDSISNGFHFRFVALLAEGVDRNFCSGQYFVLAQGRPPRGGRG